MEFDHHQVSPPLSPQRRHAVELKPVYSSAVNTSDAQLFYYGPSPSPEVPSALAEGSGVQEGVMVNDSHDTADDSASTLKSVDGNASLTITSGRIGASSCLVASHGSMKLAALPIRDAVNGFLRREGRALVRLRRAPAHPGVALPIGFAGDTDATASEGGAVLLLAPFHVDLHTVAVGGKGLAEANVRSIFMQMLSAVEHCHANGVLLGDMRLSKFAFPTSDLSCVRLVDLTRASVLGSEHVSDCMISASYITPEALAGGGNDTRADPFSGDQWALGIALYVLLSGRFPFDLRDADELYQQMWTGPPPLPDHVSSDARDLCVALLDRSPLFRPSCTTALKHPWFTKKQRRGSKRYSESDSPVSDIIANSNDSSSDDAVVPELSPKRRNVSVSDD